MPAILIAPLGLIKFIELIWIELNLTDICQPIWNEPSYKTKHLGVHLKSVTLKIFKIVNNTFRSSSKSLTVGSIVSVTFRAGAGVSESGKPPGIDPSHEIICLCCSRYKV